MCSQFECWMVWAWFSFWNIFTASTTPVKFSIWGETIRIQYALAHLSGFLLGVYLALFLNCFLHTSHLFAFCIHFIQCTQYDSVSKLCGLTVLHLCEQKTLFLVSLPQVLQFIIPLVVNVVFDMMNSIESPY